MNNKEVYINERLIDLDEVNNPIQLTYSINDLAELKDRQAYSTNTFKIPKTQNNLSICGYPDNPNLIQLQPYRKNSAKIIQNGIEILTNGIAIIDATGNDIQVQILSGLIGFFDLLADKKISDLDFSEYDHVWNLQTVANSQNNTEGYIYPIIDYGGLNDSNREADVKLLRPATFRKTIIDKIVSEAGYTINGNPLTYEKYIKSVVAFSNDKFSHDKAFSDVLAKYKTSARNTNLFITNKDLLNQPMQLNDDATTDPMNNWNGTEYLVQQTARYKIDFKYNLLVQGTSISVMSGLIISIQLNGNDKAVIVNDGVIVGKQFENQVLTIDLEAKVGDRIKINIKQKPAVGRAIGYFTPGCELKIEAIVEDVIYGSDVQLSATLPDVSQKNFFKDFLQNFGLIVIPDNYRKELKLINMEEVYSNKPNAFDITDRLISSVDDVSFSFGNYGVNNYGKYKQDDAIPDGLGDGLLLLDNQTLDENVTIFTSIFAASQNVFKMGGVEVAQIKKIENISESTNFTIKTQPRILLDTKINTEFKLFDGTNEQIVNIISTPKFNGLEYSFLFEENYPEIVRMLYRPFVVEKSILLKETDIASLDWTIPVYDGKSASYYYKNQIKYVQNGLSKISLIRMV